MRNNCGCTPWKHANDPSYNVCDRHEREFERDDPPLPSEPCAVCGDQPAVEGTDLCPSCTQARELRTWIIDHCY